MGYRTDSQARCDTCVCALAEGEATYGEDGRLLCRRCGSSALIAATAKQLAEQGKSQLGDAPMQPNLAELSVGLGLVFLAPLGLGAIGSNAALLEHLVSGSSCSELGCLGIALLSIGGVVVGAPSALLGLVLLPRRFRVRALWGSGLALLLCLLPLLVLA